VTSFLAQFDTPNNVPPPATAPPPAWGPTPYAATALAREVDTIQRAPEGTRNDTLNRAAFNIGQLIAGGQIHHDDARDALISAAIEAGLTGRETARTIDSGFREGQKHPRYPTAPMNGHTPIPPAPDNPEQALERTSWYPRDLTAILQGEQEPEPAYLTRTDGHALFYAGKVNGLIGESESGKTWLALLAVTQALQAGHRVLYLDFEDSPTGIINRLRALGAEDLTGLTYIDPDGPLTIGAQADLTEVLATPPHLVILDGFNAAMTLMGLDLMSNKDATQFSQQLLKPLSRTGACVIYVDHLPKNSEQQGKGGIGAQAKRAMTTGCAIRVDVKCEFGRGMKGILKLTVDKDRAGHVRANSVKAKHAGVAILDDTGGELVVRIDEEEQQEPGTWRPTVLIERVMEYLVKHGPATRTHLKEAVMGKNEAILQAIGFMIQDGLLTESTDERGHRTVVPSPVPDPSPTRPQERDIYQSPRPPTLGGGRGTGVHQDTDPSPSPDEREWYR
jgi:hypothetical protein